MRVQRVARPTVVLLQQLHGGEQHGPVLGVSDVQLVQVLLLQQLERVQVLVAIEEEGGQMLLCGDDAKLVTNDTWTETTTTSSNLLYLGLHESKVMLLL